MLPHATRLTRRDFIAKTTALAGGLGLASLASQAQAAADKPPNVVFLISDDQGWGDYSFMGHPTIETPNIDRLASQSVVFEHGYAAAPLCCPSLASMLSGLHPHQTRIATNDPNVPRGRNRWKLMRSGAGLEQRKQMFSFYREAPMLPRLLADRGHSSFQSGKWWGGHPSNAGFTAGMTHGDPLKGGRHGDEGLAIGRRTMKPVLDFVDRAVAQQRPFFLWYAPMMPHLPHNPPERLLAKYQKKTQSIHMARYWAMCEWFDETCGELLGYLDKKGIADNTLVLYICDNGWIQLEGKRGHTPRSKTSSYEGGIRTPIMVRWPGRMKPYRDDKTPVSAVDLAPTALAACGMGKQPSMQGVSLLDRQAVEKRNAAFGATYSHDAVDIHDPVSSLQFRWTIQGRWKLILPFRGNRPSDPVQLYDVWGDPHEEKNLANDSRERVMQLRGQIDAWLRVDDPLPVKFPTRPPEKIDCNFDGDTDGWSAARDLGRLELADGHLVLRAKGVDPIITLSPCNIGPDGISRVRVRMAVSAGERTELRWGTEMPSRIDKGKLIGVPVIADGEFHEYVFEVAKHPKWRGGTIQRLRFDPADAQGTIRIDWIRGEP